MALIPIGCAIMQFLRRLRRPGAVITTLAVALWTSTDVAQEENWPHASWWASGSVGRSVYVGSSLLTGIGGIFVVVGFLQLLRIHQRRMRFVTAAHGFARIVDRDTRLQQNEFGVNVWTVKGMKGFRRLVREGSAVPTPRSETPIVWTLGKGAIGAAWRTGIPRLTDLEAMRVAMPDEATFCSVSRESRFRLSWIEWRRTDRYYAVLTVPLFGKRFGRYRVRGVVAIDVLVPGKGHLLDNVQTTPAFSAIIKVCEAVWADAGDT